MFSSILKVYQGCSYNAVNLISMMTKLGRGSDIFYLPPLPPGNDLVSYHLGQPYFDFQYSNTYTLRLKLTTSGYQGSSDCCAQGGQFLIHSL